MLVLAQDGSNNRRMGSGAPGRTRRREQGTRPRPTLPAWLLSVALHGVILFVAAWLFSGEAAVVGTHHKERRAEIVLRPPLSSAERQAVSPSNEQVGTKPAATPGSSASHAESLAEFSEDVLPSVDAQPTLAGLRLPIYDGSRPPDGAVGPMISQLGRPGRPRLLPGVHDAAILAEEAARPKSTPPKGTPAELTFFGTAATGRSFVFVIDRSESMGAARLGAIVAAANELKASIAELTEEQFFQVVAYNESATIHAQRELMPASLENKQTLIAFTGKLSTFGGTQHNHGLQAALRLRPEVIYLLTDGGDPIPDPLQMRTIRDLAASGTQIHCLHFGRGDPGAGEGFLRQIAAENGGIYRYINMNRR